MLAFLQVDRLITELKLPPNDAYHKLRHTIEEVNTLLLKYGGEDAEQVPYKYSALRCAFAYRLLTLTLVHYHLSASGPFGKQQWMPQSSSRLHYAKPSFAAAMRRCSHDSL